jgi:hypothetical protein
VVGGDLFYHNGFRTGSTDIANSEAGWMWTGQGASYREPGAPVAFRTDTNPAAGSIASLNDVLETGLFINLDTTPETFDARSVNDALAAGADKPEGWNMWRKDFNVTTHTPAPANGGASVHLFDTRDLEGKTGSGISTIGWDFATIPLGSTLKYVFASPFTCEMALNVARNWFSVRDLDATTDTGTGLASSDLNLQIWQLDEQDHFTNLIGGSISLYNHTEFLRHDSIKAGR